jgi:tRNA (guanine-N7-)-methyltransferase
MASSSTAAAVIKDLHNHSDSLLSGGISKRGFRTRAHSNPLADGSYDYPSTPSDFDWCPLYPSAAAPIVTNVDVGCGYGGLLCALATHLPQELSLGMEIRATVVLYVEDRLKSLRAQHDGQFDNVAVMRSNAMKHLPNYFRKAQLNRLFFCFPDPHFKPHNHRRRIVNRQLLSEYAYVLRDGGMLYTITDVEELAIWMKSKGCEHALFELLSDAETASDPCVHLIRSSTEEGMKVARNGGDMHVAVFRSSACVLSSCSCSQPFFQAETSVAFARFRLTIAWDPYPHQ